MTREEKRYVDKIHGEYFKFLFSKWKTFILKKEE
jgi:hypothetical protein